MIAPRPALESDRAAIHLLPPRTPDQPAGPHPAPFALGTAECHVLADGASLLAFGELSIAASHIRAVFAGESPTPVLYAALLTHLEGIARARGIASVTLEAPREHAGALAAAGYSPAQRSSGAEPTETAEPLYTKSLLTAQQPWQIRPANAADCPGICAAHIESIKVLCAPHYTPPQVEAWLHGKTPELYLPLLSQHLWFVAEEAGRILGFGTLDPAPPAGESGEIRGLYLAPAATGRGIGLAMMLRLESLARELGTRRLVVGATLNAAPFYERCGYRETERTTHRTRTGVELPSIRLEKLIAPN